jgi:flavin-binding protein dodecin
MKNTFYSGLLTFALICGLAFAGCGTPKQTAYKSLAAVGISVDSAADSYALARAQGYVTDADWAKAMEVHAKYLIAYRLAVATASGDVSQYSPVELMKLELEVLAAFNKQKGN